MVINDKALDNYSNLYNDNEFPLVKAFKNKGFDEETLNKIKLIELLCDIFSKQKQIYNGY